MLHSSACKEVKTERHFTGSFKPLVLREAIESGVMGRMGVVGGAVRHLLKLWFLAFNSHVFLRSHFFNQGGRGKSKYIARL